MRSRQNLHTIRRSGYSGGYSSSDMGNDASSSLFQIGSSSVKSSLTPEEQHLWTSMLQLANLSAAATASPTVLKNVNGTSNDCSGDRVGDTSADANEEEPSSLIKTASVQEAMNLAAAAILQTDAAMGGGGDFNTAENDRDDDDDRIEGGMTMNKDEESLDAPIEGSPPLNPSIESSLRTM